MNEIGKGGVTMSSLKDLSKVASVLDKMGLFAEADVIDAFIVKATDQRKYAIVTKAKVAVRAKVYNSLSDMQDPPASSQLKADGTVTVYPVENNQVMESQKLWTKAYTATNLDQLKAKISGDVAAVKAKYAPASYDESFEFYPV